jgi:imidazole glycerol-phosphate synthase subunit HisH
MIGIIDYGMGNLRSVFNALDFLNAKSKIISNPSEFSGLSHLIIPGVGSFSKAMKNFREKEFVEPVYEFAKSGKQILGICLGMQLLADCGYEPEKTNGLGLIKGEVIKFNRIEHRIPHMGWNSINIKKENKLFEGIKKEADFYFVHSYYFVPENESDVLTRTNYGIEFTSAVSKDNITGFQFHPEKSQKQGLKILENFIRN